MHKAFKYRIFPNKEQQALINKTIGSVRFVYNHFLSRRDEEYKTNKKTLSYDACSKELTQLKKIKEWLKEVDSTSLQTTLKYLDEGFKKFFKGDGKYPKYKSKRNPVQSYTTKFTNNNIRIENNKIKLPKLGFIKFAKSREVEGKILSATIRKTTTSKYFVSIVTEQNQCPYLPASNTVGVDLGLKHFAILSNGEKIDNPKYLHKYEKELQKWQRIYSRRQKDSKNKEKARLKVAKLHEKIKNCRLDFLHKLSTKLVRENETICLEDLGVKNMQQNHKLAKSISDASWGMFKNLIEYKVVWYGRKLSFISRFFPSSQLCSECNTQFSEVKDLKVRKWICPNCQTEHDRDENAAKNIKKEGLRLLA